MKIVILFTGLSGECDRFSLTLASVFLTLFLINFVRLSSLIEVLSDI